MRELYYIPEEEIEDSVRAQIRRKRSGVVQIVISIVLTFLFICTDVDRCTKLPYWMIIVAAILAISGIATLNKFNSINEKYFS